jgi:predicted DsbA family dithiol-disulfide isomerase
MTATVTIWSDVHCPWATVAVHRLRRARDELGIDAVFDQRPWPLEWVNEQGTPRHIVEPETIVLAAHEPEIFSRYRDETWPGSFLPAFELIAAAREVHGLRAAEEVDYHLRLTFFREARDVSLRHNLRAALRAAARSAPCELDADAVLESWETRPVRAAVVADYQRSRELSIQGSPQIFWPDGGTTHNPGMTDHVWKRGIPRINSSDPQEPARLLRERVGSRTGTGGGGSVPASRQAGGS